MQCMVAVIVLCVQSIQPNTPEDGHVDARNM